MMNFLLINVLAFTILYNSIQAFIPRQLRFLSKMRDRTFLLTTVDEQELDEDTIIKLTDRARSHLITLKKNSSDTLFIRMGVKSGGCSGMSYVMDIIKPEDITEEDHIEVYDDVKCIVDPKSLLYIYGLQLGLFIYL